VRTRGRLLFGLVLALGVAGAGTAIAVAQQPEPEPYEPVVVADAPFRIQGTGDAAELVPIHRFQAGLARNAELHVFDQPGAPDGAVPDILMTNPTHEGFELAVSIIEATPDGAWYHVRLPRRPNGSTGWVRADQLDVWTVNHRVEVTLGDHMLRVFDGDSDVVLFETDVAVGRGSTPTPVGDFYIDIVNPLGGHRVYGWGQLSVSGFSEVLESFGGGIGQIALHGWNNDDIMGESVSNGCVRMRNADIERVAELAPLGTPVLIRP
jgi:lipoprotein-anchoring transpeptidase ErfK/SrfK